MRIDDFGRNPYDNIDRSKATTPNTTANTKASGTKSPGSSTSTASTSSTTLTRADKLAQLKQAVQSNKPVDLQKLADALTQTGVFFDEKA